MLQPFNRGGALARNREFSAEVGHISESDVRELMAVTREGAKNQQLAERNALLIATLFDTCLRVSECLTLTPDHLKRDEGGWIVNITRKGGKAGVAAISASLVARLNSYAFEYGLGRADRLFPFNRERAFKILKAAFEKSGITKPDHVGHVHVLRHSGALRRLEATGNPRAVQAQLGHSGIGMTLRYMSTLQTREAIKIQQGVDNGW